MARARNIKPGFFRNADLVELPVEARLLFIGMWTLADREGRIEDRPKQVKMEIFPADNFDCGVLLDSLAEMGFIKRYVVDGERCISIVNFVLHQSPHGTEKDSELPCEDGFYTVNERVRSGHVTGVFRKESGATRRGLVSSLVDTGAKPGIAPVDTTLNPEPGILNPESRILNPDYLNPDYLNPDSKARSVVIEEDARDFLVSKKAAICMVIKAEGIASVNPSHPGFMALIAEGAEVGHFASAAKSASEKGKGFAYVLATVKGQIDDAAGLANAPSRPNPPRPQAESFKERDARLGRERWEEMTGRTHPDSHQNTTQNFIDAPAKLLEIAA